MLYVAPSDNVKEHIECLANGGEFITHLWALLTHAGILQRGQKNVTDIENAGVDLAEGSGGAALRFCHAGSCPLTLAEGSGGVALRFCHAGSCPLTLADKQAAPATCAINQPTANGNCV